MGSWVHGSCDVHKKLQKLELTGHFTARSGQWQGHDALLDVQAENATKKGMTTGPLFA